jgi:hypothetical protein
MSLSEIEEHAFYARPVMAARYRLDADHAVLNTRTG